jgi:hypothetical protein
MLRDNLGSVPAFPSPVAQESPEAWARRLRAWADTHPARPIAVDDSRQAITFAHGLFAERRIEARRSGHLGIEPVARAVLLARSIGQVEVPPASEVAAGQVELRHPPPTGPAAHSQRSEEPPAQAPEVGLGRGQLDPIIERPSRLAERIRLGVEYSANSPGQLPGRSLGKVECPANRKSPVPGP